MPEFFSSLMLLGAFGSNDSLPFWATANQYGLMPDKTGVLVVASAGMNYNEEKTLQYHWGMSLAGRFDAVSHDCIPDEIYAGIKWKFLSLDLGIWHQDRDFLASDPLLGSLSTTAGRISWTGNARSMPGYSFNILPVSISGKNNIVQVFGNWADYRTTDLRYVQNSLLHNMRIGLRFNIKRFAITLGWDHWAEWSGYSPDYGEMPSGIGDYFRMCLGLKASSSGSAMDQENVLGDQRGALLIRLDYNADDWKIVFQHDIPYEDKSGMYFKNFPDGVNTLAFSFNNKNRWVSDIVYEFTSTMRQSGPLHQSEGDKPMILGGCDDYFNNGEYKSGWTAYGRTIGLPLLCPQGTREGTWRRDGKTLGVENNRIMSHHIGLSGKLFRKLPYRLMLTYSQNFGRYSQPWTEETRTKYPWPAYNQFSAGLSLAAPVTKRLQLLPSISFDCGEVLKNSLAVMLGLRYDLNGKALQH